MKFKVKKRPKVNVYEWHKKFVWLPTKVNETDIDYEIAFGETIMQKQGHDARNKYKRYTQQEYFKRVLADEDDVASDKKDPWKTENISHDGTDFNIKAGGTRDFEVTKGSPKLAPSTSDPDVGFGSDKTDQITLVRDGKGQITKVKKK